MNLSLRKIVLLLADAVFVNLSIYIMLLLRFDGAVPHEYGQAFLSLIPLCTFIFISSFILFRLYNRVWEYASIGEMLAILKATVIGMTIFVGAIYAFHLKGLPPTIYFGAWVFINVCIGGSRVWWRVFRDYFTTGKKNVADCKRVLVIGAGNAGAILIKEIQNNPQLKLNVVGVVDDDPDKKRLILHNVPILDGRKKITQIVEEMTIDEIILAMPSAPGEAIREIVDVCKRTPARVRILPGIYQSTDNLIHNIRDVQMEDLLKRNAVELNLNEIAGYISGRVILVTGAGGSIGSELCRQLLHFSPKRLVILDNNENNLFEIEIELKAYKSSVHIWTELVDVRDHDRLEAVFSQQRPDVVFHAAAYKHVPMMQRHPDLALNNNVVGTRNAVILSDHYGVKSFIFISTDKAVNPTSVMGASKRIAEMVVNDMSRKSRTVFASVRFGNVLGSRGSVIPTFMKQIDKGGPVTVTHPDMKRYFMTIPEAVQLVIEAGALAQGGETFVLDMGEMIKIDDLARELIRLSGYEPDKDIPIIYTGMRPGEKLYEEIFTNREEMASTRHERIYISPKGRDSHYVDLTKSMGLILKSPIKDKSEVLKIIMELVPEYQGLEGMPRDDVSYSRRFQNGQNDVMAVSHEPPKQAASGLVDKAI